MSVDVEIYLSQLFKFFKDNPKDLNNLVPRNKEDEFFEKCRTTVYQNEKKGEEISLTRQQLIDICVEVNKGVPKEKKEIEIEFAQGKFMQTKYGLISLN